MEAIPLPNGILLPRLGLGTFEVKDEPILDIAIREALRAGYRLIDTAQCYKNEEVIGRLLWPACRDLGIRRGDMFITTKIHPAKQGYEKAKKSITESIALLQTDYIDCILIHWPGAKGVLSSDVVKNRYLRLGTWEALCEAYSNGVVRSIGVSNYMISHLTELCDHVDRINLVEPITKAVYPMINQIEIHPGWQSSELLHWCKQHNIIVQGYSSLGRGVTVLDNECIKRIATELGVTPAHVCILWSLQQDIPIIPKSVHPDRIVANWNAQNNEKLLTEHHFELIKEQVPQLKVCWDPDIVL